jgi:phosphatidylglycerophosphate synthase
MLANWITLSRLPLLLLCVPILYVGSPPLQLAGAALLFLGLMLDTVDGMVARRTGRTSLLGSVLDVAADRTYELMLWICFADLHLIPVAIPLIVVLRTTLTDALRSIGIGQGAPPFAQHRTALGRFLVGSSWMRTGYSISKVVTFCGLALAQAFAGFGANTRLGLVSAPLLTGLQVVAWMTVTLCLLRGLPVIVGTLRRYGGADIGVREPSSDRGFAAELSPP